MLIISILRYLDKEIKKVFFWIFGIIFLLEVIAAYTNPLHQLFVKLLPSASVTFEQINSLEHGILFFIHMIICYGLLIVVFALILKKLYSNLKKDRDVVPFVTMLFGIIIGVSFNMIHVFYYVFIIDPTYMAFVIIVSLLYLSYVNFI